MLKGMVSLVTGGASGLGKATAERFVRNGGKVLICDIQSRKGKEVAEQLGENVCFFHGNVSSEQDITKALEVVKDKFGRLDTVVNCAGIAHAYQTYNFTKKRAHQLETFEELIKTNTIGTFNVIRLAVGLIGENEPNEDGQRGVIINTACISAVEGEKGQAAYASSKAAIVGMTLPIARDLGPTGIRVVTIAPGLFNTPVLDYMPADVLEWFGRMTPFPSRLGRPEEFAHLVTSIVENTMINGSVIRLDGGFRMVS